MDESHVYGENMEPDHNTIFYCSTDTKYLLTMEHTCASMFPPEASRWREALTQRDPAELVNFTQPLLPQIYFICEIFRN